MEFFEIMEGQSVQLVRGGPEMLIKSVNFQGVECTWYDSIFRKHRWGVFQPSDLRIFEPADSPAPSFLP